MENFYKKYSLRDEDKLQLEQWCPAVKDRRAKFLHNFTKELAKTVMSYCEPNSYRKGAIQKIEEAMSLINFAIKIEEHSENSRTISDMGKRD